MIAEKAQAVNLPRLPYILSLLNGVIKMGVVILRVIIGLLTVIGVAGIIRFVSLAIVSSGTPNASYVVRLGGKNADLQLISAIETARFGWFERRCPVVALMDDVGEEEKEKCKIVAEGANVVFCNSSEISEWM